MRRLKDENLNLRIDNRTKELAISELHRRLNEDRDTFVSAMQDMSYKLGAAETRLAQIEAPNVNAGEKMHRRAGVKMHHGGSSQGHVQLRIQFD
jgi:hypothetical protein